MKNRWIRHVHALAGLFLLLLTGCVNGAIYQHTTEPLDVDFDNTPVHDGGKGGSWKTLVVPIYYQGAQVQVDWGDMSIAHAMKKAGMETVHYADLETTSVLGVWTERTVHIYGE